MNRCIHICTSSYNDHLISNQNCVYDYLITCTVFHCLLDHEVKLYLFLYLRSVRSSYSRNTVIVHFIEEADLLNIKYPRHIQIRYSDKDISFQLNTMKTGIKRQQVLLINSKIVFWQTIGKFKGKKQILEIFRPHGGLNQLEIITCKHATEMTLLLLNVQEPHSEGQVAMEGVSRRGERGRKLILRLSWQYKTRAGGENGSLGKSR